MNGHGRREPDKAILRALGCRGRFGVECKERLNVLAFAMEDVRIGEFPPPPGTGWSNRPKW